MKHRHARAFSLLEVMIAMAVFFIVVFAILGVVVSSLGQARALQTRHPDAGMLAAELSLTNCLTEGSESGDFGDIFPGTSWTREISPFLSNQLWLVEWAVVEKSPRGGKAVTETMQVLMFKPECNSMGVRR